ncbi:unnamed protein product, partial [Prorocentrum cordatum]
VVQEAGQARVQCDGRAAGIRRDLVADLVFPTWPGAGEVGVVDLAACLEGELLAQVSDPWKCLLPRKEWPLRPARSKVHGGQEEWDKLVKEGLRRGLFREAAPAAFFRGRAGHPIFSGAMGADKEKVVDGVPRSFLRFVSILTPSNEHTRPIQGDVDFLPFIAQAMLVVLKEDESAVVDSEDFVSCFNLLRAPRSWDGFLVYGRPVSGAVLGRRAEDAFRVSLATVPMGLSGAVAVVQAAVRRLVLGEAEVDLATEVAKSKAFPNGPNYSFVHLDSFDFIRVWVRALAEAMAGQESPEHRRLVNGCAAAMACRSTRRRRGRDLLRLSVGIAAAEVAAEAALRHWAGLACFCAVYRRPLFSILQDIFAVIDSPGRQGPVHASALEEPLLLSALAPLAGANLRAQVGPHISCSDASPHGGGAAVADSFGALGATPAFAEVSGNAGASLSEAGGRGTSGPLRSSRRLLGAAGASGDHRSRLWASNELAGLAIRALEARLVRPGFTVVSQPPSSWLWRFPRARWLMQQPGIFPTEALGRHWMHNSLALHRRVAERLGQQGEVCEDELWGIYADVVAAACRAHGEASCPQGPGQQALWLSAQLREATERLGDAQLNEVMVQEIMDWLSAMQAGGEEGQLRDLVRAADHRGSDVRLWASEVLRSSRQTAPYPAFCWQWKPVSSYAWRSAGHINVLEVLAFVNYVKFSLKCVSSVSRRFVHVLDGMVATAVISKGRSTSRRLNGPLREVAGYLLAADAYPFAVWTISDWSFADQASRRVEQRQ